MNDTVLVAVIGAAGAVLAALIAKPDVLTKTGQFILKSFRPSSRPATLKAGTADQPREGSSKARAPKVEVSQLSLRSAGYHVKVDGIIGQQTASAIIQLQKQLGLPVTGLLDDATLAALAEARESFKPVQRMLLNMDYPIGVDGLCGSNTMTALRDFQTKHGLQPSGLADTPTRRLLTEISEARATRHITDCRPN